MKIASELERQKRTNLRSIQFLGGRYWNLLTTGKTRCDDPKASTVALESGGKMIYHPNSEYRCDSDGPDSEGVMNEEYLCSDCGVTWKLRIPTEND